MLKIWSAAIPPEAKNYAGAIPGAVVEIIKDKGVIVLTGDGGLMIKDVQPDSGDRQCACNILDKHSIRLGRR